MAFGGHDYLLLFLCKFVRPRRGVCMCLTSRQLLRNQKCHCNWEHAGLWVSKPDLDRGGLALDLGGNRLHPRAQRLDIALELLLLQRGHAWEKQRRISERGELGLDRLAQLS